MEEAIYMYVCVCVLEKERENEKEFYINIFPFNSFFKEFIRICKMRVKFSQRAGDHFPCEAMSEIKHSEKRIE